MNNAENRRIATVGGDGRIRLEQQETPPIQDGTVLVEVHASVVSPGSELGSWRGLKELRDTPNPNRKPRAFGYANAGLVIDVGHGVNRFEKGDRVCCMGGGYAFHTDYAVVPHHLCVSLPGNVSFTQGAYGHLAATALHALRRNGPQIGDYTAIVGLGLVGQLVAQIHRLAGCYVIGWDVIELRLEIAKKTGIDAAVHSAAENAAELTRKFTADHGLDSAIMAFGGDGTSVFDKLVTCFKRAPDGHFTGPIVIVGGTKVNYNAATHNIDIRRAARTGPGYHDKSWEYGADYPNVHMRWTTRTNLELCMRWISEGRLLVDPLTTHTIQLADVEDSIEGIIADPDSILGVVFQCQ